MIDVLKRLAQLDAKSTSVVKEGQVQECGPMGMMDDMPGMHGMMAEKPAVPANFSINATAANEQLQTFFNKQNIIGFEKTAERKLGNTIYVTGKLLSSQNKYSLTLLLEVNKKGFEIVSVRIS